MKETRWVEKTPEADLVVRRRCNQDQGRTEQRTGPPMNNWQAKTAAEVAELTLNPDDAVTE